MSIQLDYEVALIGYIAARLSKLGEQPYELGATLTTCNVHDSFPVPLLLIERVLDARETRRVSLKLDAILLTVSFFDVKVSREHPARAPTHCSPHSVREQFAFLWSEIAHHLRV